MIIDVKVKPGSKRESILLQDGVLVVKIREKPIEGKANKALVEKLAEKLGIAKSCIEIISGQRSRNKRVSISCVDDEVLREKLSGGL